MSKRKSKKQKQEVARILRAINIACVSISFAWLLFFGMLALKGGWDDIDIVAVLGAPIFAVLALILALVRIYKNKSQNAVALAPLIALTCSALLFCYIAVNESVMFFENL